VQRVSKLLTPQIMKQDDDEERMPPAVVDVELEAAVDEDELDGEEELGFQPLHAVSDELKKSRLQILGARTSKENYKRKWAKAGIVLKEQLSQQPQLQIEDADHNILARTKVLQQAVDSFCEAKTLSWGTRTRRLAVAALMIYRMRMVDIFLREHVMLMWVIFGEHSLRAHNGTCYYYNSVGFFEPFQGLLPEGIYDVLKTFLLRLEGLFRSMSGEIRREDSSLLGAIQLCVATFSTEAAALNSFTDASILMSSDKRSKVPSFGAAVPVVRVDQASQVDDDDVIVSDKWPINTAQAVSKVAQKMQFELLGNKLIGYFIEWCDTPHQRQSGVAYKDAIILYDIDNKPLVFAKERSARNNIYVGFARNLLTAVDPTLNAAILRTQVSYERTFWANDQALDCMQAGEALAKRRVNVDTFFMLLGPGGVGLSVFSAALAARYGNYHKYVDPNIFFQDEELRKQIENMATGLFFTGQEKPEAGRKTFKIDLFNKFATAEGIHGRLPYSILTKIFELIGWKRLEMNKMFRFEGVTEAGFNAILRRSLLIKIVARFFDAKYLAKCFPNHEDYGIFPRDPTLKAFLTSDVGIAAGMQVQFAFESSHGEESCRTLIQDYLQGGDNGLTLKYMRHACGLKAVDPMVKNKNEFLGITISSSQDEELLDEEAKQLPIFSRDMIQACVKKFDKLNKSKLTLWKDMPASAPRMCRLKIYEAFIHKKLWKVAIGRQKNQETIMPVIFTAHGVDALFPTISLADVAREYPEQWNASRFLQRTSGNGARKMNSDLLADILLELKKM
jgi:hypothetical protein